MLLNSSTVTLPTGLLSSQIIYFCFIALYAYVCVHGVHVYVCIQVRVNEPVVVRTYVLRVKARIQHGVFSSTDFHLFDKRFFSLS